MPGYPESNPWGTISVSSPIWTQHSHDPGQRHVISLSFGRLPEQDDPLNDSFLIVPEETAFGTVLFEKVSQIFDGLAFQQGHHLQKDATQRPNVGGLVPTRISRYFRGPVPSRQGGWSFGGAPCQIRAIQRESKVCEEHVAPMYENILGFDIFVPDISVMHIRERCHETTEETLKGRQLLIRDGCRSS